MCRSSKSESAFVQMAAGEHVCYLYDHDEGDVLPDAIALTASKPHQRVLFLFAEANVEVTRRRLQERGMDPATLEKEGRLQLLSARKTLAPGGEFVPEFAVEQIRRASALASQSTFSGFFLISDMSWIDPSKVSSEDLVEFEALVDSLVYRDAVAALSIYNMATLGASVVNKLLFAFPRVCFEGAIHDNSQYLPADELLGDEREGVILRKTLGRLVDRKRTEDALLESEGLYRALFNQIAEGFALHEVVQRDDGSVSGIRVIEANPALERITGVNRSEMIGKTLSDLIAGLEESFLARLIEAATNKTQTRIEVFIPYLARYYEITVFSPSVGQLATIFSDITSRKREEEKKERADFRIRQSQKMEAIGRLAGGVAHDFNNILTAIAGLADVLLDEIPDETTHRADVVEIKQAADRATMLTRQLLSFSRKQSIAPRSICLNQVVKSLHNLLARIIGEDIEFVVLTDEALGKVRLDPSQLEQILVNLAANARDAMPNGGSLTMETRNIVLDEDFCRGRDDVSPGPYVMLSVRDTGCGMDDTVLERIFEPFYTTKAKGKGTGLGLATVYGIVTQNRGIIGVSSGPGKGSAFDVFLPRVVTDHGEDTGKGRPVDRVVGGSETVLLVEDEDMVRNLAKRILSRHGYSVLAAAGAPEALKVWLEHWENIDILLTDVIMPQMNGRQLYLKLAEDRANLKVLYMSGYPQDVIEDQGVHADPKTFIEKPFPAEELVRRIRGILDS